MPNPTVPDFTDVAASKLADLLEKGFVITGVCFERQVEGTQPQRGFVDFAGFVGWWRSDDHWGRRANELHAAFGNAELPEFSGCVADMKGSQDEPASPPVQSQA